MTATKEYSGKTVVVTGAARGIGFGIARRFGEEGAHIIIVDINSEQGLNAVHSLRKEGLTADFVHADLSVPGGACLLSEVPVVARYLQRSLRDDDAVRVLGFLLALAA